MSFRAFLGACAPRARGRRLALLLVLMAAPWVASTPALALEARREAPVAAEPGRGRAIVARVIDGDTIDVWLARNRRERVRLIGLDTPELGGGRRLVECFAREAAARARALLPVGSAVELEADSSQADRDRFDRLLRYVWLPDGRNVAEVMIAEGFGFEYTYARPYRYQERFKAAQREAREQDRGLWAPETCGGRRGLPEPPVGQAPPPPGPPGRRSAGPELAAYPCEPGQIKGNRRSGIYHVPGGASYARTYADVACFDSEAEAAAAGFRRARR